MTNPYRPPQESRLDPLPVRQSGTVLSIGAIIVLSCLLPGLPSILQRRQLGGFGLLLTIPAAFVFFGPFWDMVLFAGTNYGQAGLYPFVVTVVCTCFSSLWHGLSARRQIVRSRHNRGIET